MENKLNQINSVGEEERERGRWRGGRKKYYIITAKQEETRASSSGKFMGVLTSNSTLFQFINYTCLSARLFSHYAIQT